MYEIVFDSVVYLFLLIFDFNSVKALQSFVSSCTIIVTSRENKENYGKKVRGFAKADLCSDKGAVEGSADFAYTYYSIVEA